MGNETIFYRTERSSIIYFVTEESITGSRRCIKPRLWQKIKFSSFDVDEEELHIGTVMIPDIQKGWRKEKLLRLMRASIAERMAYSENADVVMQPEVQLMSGQEDSFLPISWSLAGKLLDNRQFAKKVSAKRREPCIETVVLLLGDSLFPEEQMQKFDEMLQPYLSRINHLTILYSMNDNNDVYTDFEQEKNRWEEAIAEYTEELYYEYGLVAMVQCGREFCINRSSSMNGCGAVLFLDFGYSGKIPLRMIKAGDIYLDVFSSAKKEALFRRKCVEIYYMSPRKYLDTVVKSGYDKLVNQELQI